MIKEELARQYADHKVEERNEYPCVTFQRRKELTRYDVFDIEQAYEDGFVHGAEKLLKMVWHDTSTEEPEEEKDLLLMFELKDGRKSFSIGLYSEHSQKVWVSENRSFHWMKLSHYSRWAYIDDLLPYIK